MFNYLLLTIQSAVIRDPCYFTISIFNPIFQNFSLQNYHPNGFFFPCYAIKKFFKNLLPFQYYSQFVHNRRSKSKGKKCVKIIVSLPNYFLSKIQKNHNANLFSGNKSNLNPMLQIPRKINTEDTENTEIHRGERTKSQVSNFKFQGEKKHGEHGDSQSERRTEKFDLRDTSSNLP